VTRVNEPVKIASVDERRRRIGKNEALFREVNERIERVTESLQVTTENFSILCECGDDSCMEQVEVSLGEYERVRGDPALFFVRKGHEEPDVEDVVEQTTGYDIVRKRSGGPAELASELDPRS
jgi:hypothetical protein